MGAYLSIAIGMIIRGLGLIEYIIIVVYIGTIVILILIILMLGEGRRERNIWGDI